MTMDESILLVKALTGVEIDEGGGNCPFQASGCTSNGMWVYFRARGECASLEVYSHYDGSDSLPDVSFLLAVSWVQSWDEYQAGWISWEDFPYIFHYLWTDIKDYLQD